jgi:lactate permease
VTWVQNYNPLGSTGLSVAAAILPSVVLFGLLVGRRAPAWLAAAAGCITAALVAHNVFHMPVGMVGGAAAIGLVYGVVRLGWMLFAALFVYRITVESGQFAVVKQSVAAISTHRGIQALCVAFALGTILEGVGGGAAVVIATAILCGLGFQPLKAAVLALVGNSLSVAFGGMGNPIRALAAAAKIGQGSACAGVGRVLVPAALLLPFWIVLVNGDRRDIRRIWPAVLVSGGLLSVLLLLGGRVIPAGTIDFAAGAATLALLVALRRPAISPPSPATVLRAWSAFLLFAVLVVVWTSQPIAGWLDSVSLRYAVPGIHLQVIAAPPIAGKLRPEPAILEFPWLAAPGTAAFLAGLLAAPLAGLSIRREVAILVRLARDLRFAILALGLISATSFVTRYAGMDGAVGSALAGSGSAFPLVTCLIGWLGAVFSGTAAGSNTLFGNLQAATAKSVGLSPLLGASANAAGGAMGKMLSASSLVVTSAAAELEDGEGSICRRVLGNSLSLLLLVTVLVVVAAAAFRNF